MSGIAGVIVAAVFVVGCISTCDDDLAQKNKAIAMEAMQAIIDGELDRLDQFIAADYVRHSQSSPIPEMRSLKEFQDWLAADRASFPDGVATIDLVIAEGDMVAMWGTYSGTQAGPMGPFPPTGKTMKLDFCGMHRLDKGKIVETWVTWDNLASLIQLGHFPPPGAEGAAAGE